MVPAFRRSGRGRRSREWCPLFDVRDEAGEVANGARFSTFGTRPAKSRMVPAFRRSGRGRRSREWCPLFDVRDEGGEVANGARFSTTKAETSFHTDASFHPRLPDYAGLLCLRVAKRGGSSQLVSAYSIHNRLLATQPDLLGVLYQSFLFDRRGEHEQGDSSTSEAPVFSWDGAELTVRYLDLYIREGHRLAGRSLTEEQQSALRAMENLCSDPALQFELGLEPGQMLFVNNRWLLHNRTSFEDHRDPTLRRHLVRLWLSRRQT